MMPAIEKITGIDDSKKDSKETSKTATECTEFQEDLSPDR